MSTITAILEPNPDGTLHLPLPPEMRSGKVRVTATFAPVSAGAITGPAAIAKGFGCLKGKIWLAPDFGEPLEDFQEYME